MYSVRPLKWKETHNKWSDIKFPEPYQQYLLDTFGLTIVNGRVIWGHVVEVTLAPAGQGGAGEDIPYGPKEKKKKCKEIKLIFIMGDLRRDETKEKCEDKIPTAVVTDIKNNIEEQLGTKLTLSDVQIIKG